MQRTEQEVLVDMPMETNAPTVRAPRGLTMAAVEAAWSGGASLAEPLLGAERPSSKQKEERSDQPEAPPV